MINKKIIFGLKGLVFLFVSVFLFGLILNNKVNAATYCVRADGVGAKASSTDCTSASTSMSLATFQASSFIGGDVINFSGRGGVFYPASAVFLPGAADSPINFQSEQGFQAIFDGQGDGASSTVGVGPLIYISFSPGQNYKANLSGIKMQNWKYNTWGLVPQNAIATISNVDFIGKNGQTAIEVIGTSTVTINDITNFGGTYTTHWIGVHDASVVTINRCSGIGGQVNAVHSIGSSSVTINDCTVTSPASGGTYAFYLQGSGTNVINRSKVIINRSNYAAFHNEIDTSTNNNSTVVINNPVVIFQGAGLTSASAFQTNYYAPSNSVGSMTINNGTVYSTNGAGMGFNANEGGAGTSTIVANNTIFYNLDKAVKVSAGGSVTCNTCVSYNNGNNIVLGSFTNNNPITQNPKLKNVAVFDFSPLFDSPVVDAGINTAITSDFASSSIYGTPDIGAYEYQPPHTIGTDKIDIGAGARIYGDGKFRELSTITNNLADIAIRPQSGSFPIYNTTTTRPEWLNITNLTWNKSGDYSKQWTENSQTLATTTTSHTIGDLLPNTDYVLSVDQIPGKNITPTNGMTCSAGICRTDANGKLYFLYTGGYSTHTFTINPLSAVSGGTISAPSSIVQSIIQPISTSTSATTQTTSTPANTTTSTPIITNTTQTAEPDIKVLENQLSQLKIKLQFLIQKTNKNLDIKNLQIKLQDLGFFPKSIKPNGILGPTTKKSLIKFQRKNNIPATGKYDKKTREMLERQ